MFEEKYSSEDEIPAGVRHLYVEKDGEFVLISSSEVKNADSVKRLEESLRKERADHKETKSKLRKFGNLDPEEVQAELDKIDEYKQAAEGKLDEEQINEIVEKRITSRTRPLERQLKEAQDSLSEVQALNNTLTQEKHGRIIQDEMVAVGKKLKLNDSGLDDAVFRAGVLFEIPEEGGPAITKEGMRGVEPGQTMEEWVSGLRDTKPRWFEDSEPGGSQGSQGSRGLGGENPFSAEHWNQTKQGQLVMSDRKKAEKMAAAAGVEIGATKPAKSA